MNGPAQEFEDIGSRTISEAEKVKCSLGDFIEGLRDIEISVRERRQLAEEEVRSER